MLESHLAKYQDVMPLCERLVRLGIELGELIALHTAIGEKADAFHFHRPSDRHSFEVQPRPRQIDHHRCTWPSQQVPVLVRLTRGRNADVVADPEKPHGKEMDTPIIIKCREVRDERHRKELVDLGGAEDEGSICGSVRRAACHIVSSAPSVAADIANSGGTPDS
jgi:hypothetical protein